MAKLVYNSIWLYHLFSRNATQETPQQILINNDIHIRHMRLIADDVAEIFKFKNCRVGNYVKCVFFWKA